MNKQTLLLVVIILLLLIPTGAALHAFSIDKYTIMAGEGGVAYSIAGIPDTPLPEPTPTPPQPPLITKCDKCKGTKQVKSGDGLICVPCPCGVNCKCEVVKKAVPVRQGLYSNRWPGDLYEHLKLEHGRNADNLTPGQAIWLHDEIHGFHRGKGRKRR